MRSSHVQTNLFIVNLVLYYLATYLLKSPYKCHRGIARHGTRLNGPVITNTRFYPPKYHHCHSPPRLPLHPNTLLPTSRTRIVEEGTRVCLYTSCVRGRPHIVPPLSTPPHVVSVVIIYIKCINTTRIVIIFRLGHLYLVYLSNTPILPHRVTS
jgi:hypothetical protein